MKQSIPLLLCVFLVGCGEKSSPPKREPVANQAVVEAARPLPEPVAVGVPEKNAEQQPNLDEPLALVTPQVIGNVKAWVVGAKLIPMPKDVTDRQGEACWEIYVRFLPVNGRKKYEFWASYFTDSGEPILRVGNSKLAMVGLRHKAQKDDSITVAATDKVATMLYRFEATPDPVDHLDVSIPTQLEGHEFEAFRFRLPAKVLDRKEWDGRGKK